MIIRLFVENHLIYCWLILDYIYVWIISRAVFWTNEMCEFKFKVIYIFQHVTFGRVGYGYRQHILC